MPVFLSLAGARKEALNLMCSTKKPYQVLGVHRAKSLLVAEYIMINSFGFDPETTAFRKKANYIYVRISQIGYYVVPVDYDESAYLEQCKAITFDILHRAMEDINEL